MKRHINLCTHSNGSKMETVITPTEIVEFAVKDGARAAALTDLNSVDGFQEFAKAAEKYEQRLFFSAVMCYNERRKPNKQEGTRAWNLQK